MLSVALTGNIGSGKTTVATIFNVMGIPVFNADVEAKNLYNDNEVLEILRNSFSDAIFTIDGRVDKKKLASLIFNDKEALAKINRIIHPLVLSKFQAWKQSNSFYHYTIHETAILFENNLEDNFDYIINVSATLEVRIQRVITRDSTSRDIVVDRINNQLSDELKNEKSDFIIFNNENDLLIPQVLDIHKTLMSI